MEILRSFPRTTNKYLRDKIKRIWRELVNSRRLRWNSMKEAKEQRVLKDTKEIRKFTLVIVDFHKQSLFNFRFAFAPFSWHVLYEADSCIYTYRSSHARIHLRMKMENLMVWKYCNYDWIWVENLWKFIARSSGVEDSLFDFGISTLDIHSFYGIIDFSWGCCFFLLVVMLTSSDVNVLGIIAERKLLKLIV